VTGASSNKRWLILCAVVGVLVAAAIGASLVLWAPLTKHVRLSLVPYEAGAAIGTLIAVWMASRRVPKWKPLVGRLALSFGLAAALVVGTLIFVPKGLHRTHFPEWIPVIAGSGLGLWILAFLFERAAGRRIALFTSLIFGVALAAMTLQLGQYQYKAFAGERVRAWNVFHYYVGSKYFPELSYYDLYAATLMADDDRQARKERAPTERERKRLGKVKDFEQVKKARDQRTYKVELREDIVAGFDRDTLSRDRLRQLGKDTRFMRKYMGFGNPGWSQTFKDLGYNPAPPWTVIGVPLSNVVPTKWPWFWVISNSDVPLYVLTFCLLWWAFGLRMASVMALWLCTAQLNEARFTGGFLQYDWMCSCLCALALYHRGRHKLSGVALSWGAMTRVFPGFLIFGIVLKVLIDVIGLGRKLRSEGSGLQHRGPFARIQPAHWNFLLAFTMACGVLFVGSHLTGRGLDTWPEWVDKIGRHSEMHPVTSNMRIGVGRLVIHQPRTGRFWSEARGTKRQKLEQGVDRKHMYQALGLAVLLLALIRRRDEDTMILMLFAVFCGVVLSRYYASTWAMLFVLGAAPRGSPLQGRIALPAFIAGATLLTINAFYYALGGTTPAYFVINYVAYTLFFGLCLAYIGHDLWAWRKARRELGGASPEL
jgi:hypothetical protein